MRHALVMTLVLGLAGGMSLQASTASAQAKQLRGSDTLFTYTEDLLGICSPTIPASALVYRGGGSTLGETEMEAGNQQIAPMSRFIDSGSCTAATTRVCATDLIDNNNNGTVDEAGELCGTRPTVCDFDRFDNNNNGTIDEAGEACVAGTSPAQGCNVALDAVAAFADYEATNTCNALAHSKSMTVLNLNNDVGGILDDGTGTAVASPYVFQDWRDVLRIVYAGQHAHASVADGTGGACDEAPEGRANISTKRCNSDVRLTLVNNWNNLFEEGGCAGDPDNCTQLKHAWRRDDVSGTTDVFLEILGLPAITTAPFCNGAEQQDEDPIRRDCSDDGRVADPGAMPPIPGDPEGGTIEGDEQVCNTVAYSGLGTAYPPGSLNPGWRGGPTVNPTYNDDADLGLVLAMVIPPTNAFTPENTIACTVGASGGTFRYAGMPAGAGGQPGPNRCPDGNARVGGNCQWPARSDGMGGFVFGCMAKKLNRPGVRTIANMDGRVYNLIPRSSSGGIQTVPRVDPSTNLEEQVQIHHANYRIHATRLMPGGVVTSGSGLPGCQDPDATRQIGCLVHASPCSIGFAGLAGAGENPNKVLEMGSPALCATDTIDNDGDGTADEPGEPCAEVIADAVNPTTIRRLNDPFGAPCAQGAGDNYGLRFPLTRKLWVNSTKGFETPSDGLRDWDNIGNQNREKDLLSCACDRRFTDESVDAAGFVTLDATDCDNATLYPNRTSTAVPAECMAPIRMCP